MSLFSEDRALLEQHLIASSWSNSESARKLFRFPSDAYMRASHRQIIAAMREVDQAGDTMDGMAVGMIVHRKYPEAKEAFLSIHNLYASNVVGIDSLHSQFYSQFREEWEWQTAWETLHYANTGLRQGTFADWYQQLYQRVASIAPLAQQDQVRDFEQVYLARLDTRHDASEQGPRCMIPELDRTLGGLSPGRMILVVAPPGMGKTTLGFQLADNLLAADENAEAVFNQLEMEAEEMADRKLAMACGKELEHVTRADEERARTAAQHLRRLYMYADHCSLEEFCRRTSAHIYKRPETRLVITDYAGMLQNHGAKINAVQAANEVSQACKDIAKKHRVCHVVLQQPNRQYMLDKKPSTAHIRDSGKFEQDSHAILFLHYPHKFDDLMPENYTQLHVLKNRGGKSGGTIHLEWRPGQYTMSQWRGDLPQPRQRDAADRVRANTKNDAKFEDWTANLP